MMFVLVCAAPEYIFYSRAISIISHQDACVNTIIYVIFTTFCGPVENFFVEKSHTANDLKAN